MQTTQAYCDVGLERDEWATVVTVRGEVDLFAAPRLADALRRAVAHDQPVVVDLDDCTFFDSSGLHALLEAHLAAQRDGRRLLVARPPESSAERVFAVTAPGLFAAHRSRDAALASLGA